MRNTDNDDEGDNDNEEEHEFATTLIRCSYGTSTAANIATTTTDIPLPVQQWQLASDLDSMIVIPSANKRGKSHRSPAIIQVVLLSRTRRNTTTVIIGLMIEQNRTESVSVSLQYPYSICTVSVSVS